MLPFYPKIPEISGLTSYEHPEDPNRAPAALCTTRAGLAPPKFETREFSVVDVDTYDLPIIERYKTSAILGFADT